MRTAVQTVQGISKQALLRLPYYLNYLKLLQKEGTTVVSAPKIAAALALNEVQVRKDIALVSSCAGKPKTGFQVDLLIHDLESFLGYDNVDEAVLIGSWGVRFSGTRALRTTGCKSWPRLTVTRRFSTFALTANSGFSRWKSSKTSAVAFAYTSASFACRRKAHRMCATDLSPAVFVPYGILHRRT